MGIVRKIAACAAVGMGCLAAHAQEAVASALNETVEMIPLRGSNARIETTVFKPEGAGPFPLVVISHPRHNGRPDEQGRYRPLPAVRYFMERGYAVLAPMQQGVAKSSGWYAGIGCDLRANLRSQAADVTGVLDHIGEQPWADKSRILVVGHIHGGMTALAVGASDYPGVKGVLNFAGGWRHSGCPVWQHELTVTLQEQARKSTAPTLWFYGANDGYIADFAKPMHAAYVGAGGKARLVEFGAFQNDASFMFVSDAGARIWQADTTAFLQSIGMPSQPMPQFAKYGTLPALPVPTQYADLNDVDKVPHIRFFARRAYARFLQYPMPRAYALSTEGAAGWAWGPDAANRAVEECNKIRKGECRLYAVDTAVVWEP